VPRPCQFTDCRYHLHPIPVERRSSKGRPQVIQDNDRKYIVRLRRSGTSVAALATKYSVSEQTIYSILRGRKPPTQSCALDVADEGEHTQEEIAEAMGVSRQWVNKVEAVALAKLRRALARGAGGNAIAESNVADYFGDGAEGFIEPFHGPYHYGEDGDGKDPEVSDTRTGA
jgi:DNA-binding XRE family transcriptional regulator